MFTQLAINHALKKMSLTKEETNTLEILKKILRMMMMKAKVQLKATQVPLNCCSIWRAPELRPGLRVYLKITGPTLPLAMLYLR